MTRVLHLLHQQGAAAPTLALRLSADAARYESTHGEQHAWLLLGGEAMRDGALAVGIAPQNTRLLPVPNGVRQLVAASNRLLADVLRSADRIVCWTAGARQFAVDRGCSHAQAWHDRATLCEYAQRVVRRAAAEVSVQAGDTRAALREQWGVGEGEAVVALLADEPERLDAQRGMMSAVFAYEALSATHGAPQGLRLLCHPLAGALRQAIDFNDMIGLPPMVLQDERMNQPWRLLPGCDLALVTEPARAGLSLLWAQALGLPILAAPEPTMPELAGLDRLTLAASGQPKHLAHQLTGWLKQKSPTPAAVGSYDSV